MAAGDLCGCGKPKSHGGMCSVRWAVRKANNGPSGLKAKAPTDGPMSEEAIARRLFGDLADDILLLRAKGHTVARFRDGFRVDRDVLTAEALSARASVLRKAKERTNEIHRGAMQSKGCAKVMRAEPSMSGSAVASGDAVRDASAMPPDVVAAPYSEGREHAGSAAAAPPACRDDIAARLAHIEKRLDQLFAFVAEAVECRRHTLLDQAAGLEQLHASLRTA